MRKKVNFNVFWTIPVLGIILFVGLIGYLLLYLLMFLFQLPTIPLLYMGNKCHDWGLRYLDFIQKATCEIEDFAK